MLVTAVAGDKSLQRCSEIRAQLPAAMSSLTGGLSPDLGGAGPVKRTLEDAGDSGQRTEAGSKKYKQDLANLPTRQYLDQTVVPILLQVKRQL